MQFLSKQSIQILASLPLEEVMAHNGFRPKFHSGNQAYYLCPLPSHKDSDPSFVVDLTPAESTSGEQPLCGFICNGCHNIHGRGAIQLQAALLGLTTKGADFNTVVTRLVKDFRLTLPDANIQPNKYEYVPVADEFQYTRGEWTEEHLRALGANSMNDWSMVGDVGLDEQEPQPFPPEELTRIFGIEPVANYTIPNIHTLEDGTERSIRRTPSPMYPVFVFRSVDKLGNWRVKKYEPYFHPGPDGRNFKWSWWFQGGKNLTKRFASTVYGDVDLIRAIYDTRATIEDTSPNHNHPCCTKEWKNRDGEVCKSRLFRRIVICSGPRDAMQVYFHSDAHVVYPHSESSHISHRTLRRILSLGCQVYLLYDMDETGQRAARLLNMNYLQLANVQLPSELRNLTARRTGAPCKDISDFFEQYDLLAESIPLFRHRTPNEAFSCILSDAMPLQFWKRHNRRTPIDNGDGTISEYTYDIQVDNLLRFLSVSGMGIYKGKNEEEAPRFVCVRDNKVRFLKDGDVVKTCKEILKRWLTGHEHYNDIELRSQISRSSQILSRATLDELPIIDIDPMYWGPTWDYIFFRNGALRVEADAVRLIPYHELPFLVNEDAILAYDYEPTERLFAITPNPLFEQYERQHQEILDRIPQGDRHALEDENRRWAEERVLWPFRLELLRPMNEMPATFQFLYDTGRMYWRVEREAKRAGKPRQQWLTARQRQFQDMQFISKAAALGYVLSRFRQLNIGRMAYLVDYSVNDERKSEGGTGKSLVAKLLAYVRPECHIVGKNWKSNTDMSARNFVSYDYLKHGYINIEDLKRGVDPEELYNVANSDFNRKRLNKDEETIRARYAAKVTITSNCMFDQSAASTRRRLWPMLVSNYYHDGDLQGQEKYDPFQKFGFYIDPDSNAMPLDERNATVTMLVQFLQFFLRYSRYIEAPVGNEGCHRLLAARKEFRGNLQFIEWADHLFARKDTTGRTLFFGVPLPKVDLAISYFQYIGQPVTRDSIQAYVHSSRFGDMLRAYCDTLSISYNPPIVYRGREPRNRLPSTQAYTYQFTPSGTLATLSSGLPVRELQRRTSCYYFFPRGEEPQDQKDVLLQQTTDPAPYGYLESE